MHSFMINEHIEERLVKRFTLDATHARDQADIKVNNQERLVILKRLRTGSTINESEVKEI